MQSNMSPNASDTIISRDAAAKMLKDRVKLPVKSKNTPGVKNERESEEK